MIVLGDSKQTARKTHRCDSCLGTIEPGEKYCRARIVDGGEAWVWRAHAACQEAGVALYGQGLEGDEPGTIPRVVDMEPDDLDWLEEHHPSLHAAIWGDA
jgi:predicted RNA-binding Zn-ribbon protein involved in translation (DUF1610 family)